MTPTSGGELDLPTEHRDRFGPHHGSAAQVPHRSQNAVARIDRRRETTGDRFATGFISCRKDWVATQLADAEGLVQQAQSQVEANRIDQKRAEQQADKGVDWAKRWTTRKRN